MTFPDQIRRIVKSTPDKPCVIGVNRQLTFAEVDRRADLAADAWYAAGIKPGERLAVLSFNEIEFIEWQIAAQRAGVILVPLNTRFQPAEIQSVINDCQPRLLICGHEFKDLAGKLSVEQYWHLGDGDAEISYERRLQAASPIRREIATPDALATLLYTSGTTGSPRGTMISNRALLSRALSLEVDLRISPDDVFLQLLPMFHLAQTFSCAFSICGATNVMMPSFDAQSTLADIGRHRITRTLLVPTIMKMLIEHPDRALADLSSLQSIFYGGAPITQPLLMAALDVFRCDFYQMYGMTETGPATLLRPHHHDPERPELLVSAGTDIVTFSVGIADDRDNLCPPGMRGEIVIDSPTLMDGYWNAPDVSAVTLRNGRMHTGDIGYLDDKGLLYVTDRLKDIIVTGGENVSSVEVEKVLLAHPDVADCAVVAAPDAHLGERVHAVITPKTGVTFSELALDEHCRRQLAGYKRPRTYSVRATLPRTATGKIQKAVLREELRKQIIQEAA